ncbi:MAG: hypothetical protein HC890_19165 [Chloroflexaceae bacterium]|nr:hypothetical protein [Chloroflexaceae bacterium]
MNAPSPSSTDFQQFSPQRPRGLFLTLASLIFLILADSQAVATLAYRGGTGDV